jgi:hypothetical protein
LGTGKSTGVGQEIFLVNPDFATVRIVASPFVRWADELKVIGRTPINLCHTMPVELHLAMLHATVVFPHKEIDGMTQTGLAYGMVRVPSGERAVGIERETDKLEESARIHEHFVIVFPFDVRQGPSLVGRLPRHIEFERFLETQFDRLQLLQLPIDTFTFEKKRRIVSDTVIGTTHTLHDVMRIDGLTESDARIVQQPQEY